MLCELSLVNADFPKYPSRRNAGALEVALGGFVYPPRGFIFNESELHRVITICIDGLLLYDNAWAGLEDRNRRYRTILQEQLRHPEFLTDYSVDHNSIVRSQ